MGASYARPLRIIPTITHNNRRATATIAFFRPRRLANASKMVFQRFVRYTIRQAVSTITQRSRRDPSLVIPRSLLRPADSRGPGAKPA